MFFFKHILSVCLLGCSLLIFAGEKEKVKSCVENSLKAGFNADWKKVKTFCSDDYVKIGENQKVLDRKFLENAVVYIDRINDPNLTFSELVKLNFMIKGQPLDEKQLENYRKLDSTERGKTMVRQAQSQTRTALDDIRKMANKLATKVEYGPMRLKDNLAVWFYKFDYGVKYKGVLLLRKEKGSWKIYREFSSIDKSGKTDVAVESEVRKFALNIQNISRNFSSWKDLMNDSSPECISVMPDGSRIDYSLAEKKSKFLDMVEKGNPTMVQAGPALMEAFGKKVTAEMLAQFADMDKSGKGKAWLKQYKDSAVKSRENLRKSADDYQIKDIFVFEDCALLIDNITLIRSGRIEKISFIKKYQGKYLIYRSVSRKIKK